MADETPTPDTPETPTGNPEAQPADAAAGAPGQAAGEAPQFANLAQYVKDLSVENPNAPKSFQYKGQPKIDLAFNIDVQQIGEDVHEVVLKIEASAKAEEGTQFVVDLAYGGLFGIRNIPADQLQPLLLVEAPRLIFPFARQVIADATAHAGFQPLLLEPIDFGAIYMQRLAAARAQQQGDGAPAPAPGADTNA
ncbi:protein-export chaperone SecB [Sphingomicrobium astaxanthinifaciens]|uniref:protein-export chaperone SecB n=1 Tax=Sphingomicrobium astaxanthinifaciens TaxID=1227949 RepID=UPI001FCA5129|nr:protein-export chaperone SecB [Sphingomicrobium astaxanthinifaciens]MCJ7422116.1 protein-export chaperone SecB [Sphingomicrobium astaxanthinifaciens]